MWISRKNYQFLMENAEKNINAENEILKAKYTQTKATARAMEEYSNVLKERDELRLRVLELEKQRMTIRDIIKWLMGEKYANIDENSDTMTEKYEKEHQWELSRNRFINKTIVHLETYLDDNE